MPVRRTGGWVGERGERGKIWTHTHTTSTTTTPTQHRQPMQMVWLPLGGAARGGGGGRRRISVESLSLHLQQHVVSIFRRGTSDDGDGFMQSSISTSCWRRPCLSSYVHGPISHVCVSQFCVSFVWHLRDVHCMPGQRLTSNVQVC